MTAAFHASTPSMVKKLSDPNAVTQALVISMPSASERRESFRRQAEATTLRWTFFDALDRLQDPLVYDGDATQVHTGRPLRPGELGCYASHYFAWRQFLAGKHEQLLVLEDDVLVDWTAVERLSSVALARHGIHLLRLFSTHPVAGPVARYKLLSDHSHLLRLQGVCYGTQAYLLSRDAAATLVEICRVVTMPVDWAISRYWSIGMAQHAMVPFPVIERLVPSIIGHAQQPVMRRRGFDRRDLSRIGWRMRERCRRALADWAFARAAGPRVVDAGPPLI